MSIHHRLERLEAFLDARRPPTVFSDLERAQALANIVTAITAHGHAPPAPLRRAKQDFEDALAVGEGPALTAAVARFLAACSEHRPPWEPASETDPLVEAPTEPMPDDGIIDL